MTDEYVARTHEYLLLGNAAYEGDFKDSVYIITHQS